MENNQPLISCVLPTVGKIKVLQESIQSFLNQDYPNKELILFNNYPFSDLIFNHDNVLVINHKGEVHSAGQARNLATMYARGEYICGWDDDDIVLPNKLSKQMEAMSDNIAVATQAYYSEYNKILKNMGTYANSILFKKSYWLNRPYTHSNDDDTNMFNAINSTGKLLIINDPLYIYRWGTDTFHVSGIDNPQISQRDQILQWAKTEMVSPAITLIPGWERDYVQDVTNFING